MKKRILAGILSLIMILTVSVPNFAYAVDEDREIMLGRMESKASIFEISSMIEQRGLNILEIQPGESFNLDSNKKEYIAELLGVNKSKITLTQMSMTRFIADIDEVNGKYDIIYIGAGNGSKKKLNDQTYTEKYCVSLSEMINVLNIPRYSTDKSNSQETYSGIDITNLKAKEIIEMIESDQLVVFDKDIFTAAYSSKYGKPNIYSLFNEYYKENQITTVENLTKSYTNKYLKNDLLKIVNSYKEKSKRALLEVSQATQNPNEDADYLSINYVATNYDVNNGSMEARLYLDTNGNGKYEPDEVVESEINSELQNGIGAVFNVKVPEGASGYLNWKVEVLLHSDSHKQQVKSYQTGTLQYKPKNQQINILHIIPNDYGSFRLEKHLGTLLTDLQDYKFNITEKTVNEFEAMYKGIVGTPNPSKLNGIYHMIIFGFKDMYPDISNEAARNDIQSFIDKGQSIMFTHDSLSFPHNGTGWANKMTQQFREILGQQSYDPLASVNRYKYTNYRFKTGNQTSTQTKKINVGQITEYPYVLGDTITVSNTHTQYYQLDMEDPNVIVWYTLTSNAINWADPRNAYYTYSVGNLTFCGTGHSDVSAANREYEKKLFVNTMVKAIKSANMPPQVEILDLENEQLVLMDQPIQFRIQGTDSDFADITLDYEYSIYGDKVSKDNTTLTHTLKGIKTGEAYGPISITKEQADTLADENGWIYIYAKATDGKGAYTEKTIKVKRVQQPLQLRQTFNKVGYLTGDLADITRTLSKKFNSGKVTNVLAVTTLDEAVIEGFSNISIAEVKPEGEDNWINIDTKTHPVIMTKSGNNNLKTVLSYQFEDEVVSTSTTTSVEVVESEIKVTVKDESKRPIQGAQIKVGNNTYTTNQAGLAVIKGLATGSYNVSLNSIDGYAIIGEDKVNVDLSYRKDGVANYNKEVEFIVSGSPIKNVVLKGINSLGEETDQVTVGEAASAAQAVLYFTNDINLIYQEFPIIAEQSNNQHDTSYTYQLINVKNGEQLISGFKIEGNKLIYDNNGAQLPAGNYKATFSINLENKQAIEKQAFIVSSVKIKEESSGDFFNYLANTRFLLSKDSIPPILAAAYNNRQLQNINIIVRADGTGSEITQIKWIQGARLLDEVRDKGTVLNNLYNSLNSISIYKKEDYTECKAEISITTTQGDNKWSYFTVKQGGQYTIYIKDASGGEYSETITVVPNTENLPNIS